METENNHEESLITAIDTAVDEYERSQGLPRYVDNLDNQDAKHFLSLSRTQMEKMNLEECGEAALILGGFSFHLQRSYNREIARYNWAESLLKKTISGKEQQYSGSWDSQFSQAVNENSYALKLLKLKNNSKLRADHLTFLATSVKNMGDLFVNLQRAKAMK